MCDQDHFEEDRQEMEARGMVTRRQFGVLLAAGVAMLLPKVADAVAVTESEVTVKTADGRTITRKVENPKNLEGVSPGDKIDLTYTQAALIEVAPAK